MLELDRTSNESSNINDPDETGAAWLGACDAVVEVKTGCLGCGTDEYVELKAKDLVGKIRSSTPLWVAWCKAGLVLLLVSLEGGESWEGLPGCPCLSTFCCG